MEELAIKTPELIGREEELSRLTQSLDNAIEGKGLTIFIGGEAGIGKTRLVSELKKEAEAKGVNIIQGWCLAESLEPLMPVKTALREAGLFHLISGDPPPLVVSAYLMNEAGLLIAQVEREETNLDSDIFAGMLQAVGNFVQDSLCMMDEGGTGGLNSLGYRDFTILIQSTGTLTLATVIKGEKSEFLIEDMKSTLNGIGNEFDDWSGEISSTSEIQPKIAWFVDSGKYSGKFLVDDAKIRQENLFDNILMGLQRASSEKPIVFYLDDLQWSDPTTLNLVHYLSRNTRDNNVLILGTYRPEDIVERHDGSPHQLETAMQGMNREDLLEKMELKRLDAENTSKIIESMLDQTKFEQNFFDKIYKETDGSPFFILEVVKLLIEDEAIKQENEVWQLVKELDEIDVPSKVYDVVKRRLNRLIKEQKEILECASVIGEEFKSEIVGDIVGLNKIQLLKNLSEIEKTHQLIHYLQDMYRFDHAKVKEVLYNGIGEELRKEYHKIIGDTMVELHKDDLDEVVNELAYHYYEARDKKASEWLIKAGDKAKERYAYEEAIRLYENVLEFIEKDEKVRILKTIGYLYYSLGNLRFAISNYKAVLKSSKELDDRENEAEATLYIAHSERLQGNYHEAENLYEKSRVIWEELANFKGLANIERGLGHIKWRRGKNTEAEEHYKHSISNSMEVEDIHGVANTFIELGNLYNHLGDQENALTHYKKSIIDLEKIGDYSELARVYNNIGASYFEKKDYGKALEYFEKCKETADKIGNKVLIAWMLFNSAEIFAYLGELDKAEEYCNRSQKICEALNDKIGMNGVFKTFGIIYGLKEEWDKSFEYFNKSIILLESWDFPYDLGATYLDLARTYEAKGEKVNAIENYTTAKRLFESVGSKTKVNTIEEKIKEFEKCRKALEEL